uniref:Uncharacterized protein n=1 Tax=Anguilla anguilla TaxID=7936 RepID=A0A0E9UNG8_ANGAN
MKSGYFHKQHTEQKRAGCHSLHVTSCTHCN